MLGIWANEAESGKTPSGDLLRRKKTLPVLHAMQHAQPQDQQVLRSIYRAETVPTIKQVAQILEILDCTGSKQHCQRILREQCELARAALSQVPALLHPWAQEAVTNLSVVNQYLEEELWQEKEARPIERENTSWK
jgi:geranylgeranyl diphosphate synthase type I